jgi:hypothetical protein
MGRFDAVHVPPDRDSTTDPRLDPIASQEPATGQLTEERAEPAGRAVRAVGDHVPAPSVSTRGMRWCEASATFPTATHTPADGHETPNRTPSVAPPGKAGVVADHDPDCKLSTTGMSAPDVSLT